MQITKFYCDTCSKEIDVKDGMANLQGVIVKMNAKLEKENFAFGGNYCSECAEVILNFISKFKDELSKKDGEHTDSNSVA